MWDSFRNLSHSGKAHGRLLTVWSAVHYGSAILAFCMFCSLVRCSIALAFDWDVRPGCDSVQTLIAEFVCLGLYAITFYRFHCGDLTYLNWIYLIQELPDEEEARRLRWDLLALIGRALAFTALAQNITDPAFFFFPFALLLLLDVPWLFTRYRRSRASHSRCAETLFRWFVNNVFTLLVLVTLIVLHCLGSLEAREFLWLSALTCFTNSVVDIVMTRWVYHSTRP